jgi:hypothetical protein
MIRPDTSNPIDAALRHDPEYQALRRLIGKLSDSRNEILAFDINSQLCDSSQLKGGIEKMESKKKDVKQRIVELKEQKSSHAQIADMLNSEGYLTSKGTPWTKGAVQMALSRIIKAKGISCEPCESVDTPVIPDTPSQRCEPCESCEPSQPASMDSATLRKLIHEEIINMMPEIAKCAIDENLSRPDADIPPAIPKLKGSKRLQGNRETLPGCRIDKALHELFEKERGTLGISASELMQRILWRHYGKPKLSFEDE